jgi:uncharacterized coiled-coil DUF342 family protein
MADQNTIVSGVQVLIRDVNGELLLSLNDRETKQLIRERGLDVIKAQVQELVEEKDILQLRIADAQATLAQYQARRTAVNLELADLRAERDKLIAILQSVGETGL